MVQDYSKKQYQNKQTLIKFFFTINIAYGDEDEGCGEFIVRQSKS